MTQTAFVGTTYTVVHGTYTLEGITDVKLTQKGGPAPESKETTAADLSAYTYIPDPLGVKGAGTVSLTVTCWDSSASYGDSKCSKIPFNTAASTVWAMQPGTTNANEWTHTTLELTQRVTTIPFDGLATVALTFEGNGVGTWDSPT
jgi:hypothetical protein